MTQLAGEAAAFGPSGEEVRSETGERERVPTTRAWVTQVAEFMMVGGGTFLVLPLLWIVRRAVGLDDATYAIGALTFYGAYAVNDPHFSVTYLLFYEDARRRAFGDVLPKAQRVRYWVAGAAVPAALVAFSLGALAQGSAFGIGLLVQLMFLLVGWHYAKQGFGVLAVLSARRGRPITTRERRVILFHVYAAWAFAWANPALAAGEYEEKGVVYLAFAHPRWLELLTGVVLAASTAALVGVILVKRRREARGFCAGPLAAFLVTVWIWTIASSADPLLRYAIPALHSIQYFYFVGLLRRNEARAQLGEPWFGRPPVVRLAALFAFALALGWLLFHGLPTFLDGAYAPSGARARHLASLGPLGPTPCFAALYAVVNIHHYAMDHVLWRREQPSTRYLRG